MKTSILSALAGLTAVFAFTGCYGIFDPGSTELKTSMKWDGELPDIDPIESERRIVYLSYRDASGGDLPNLRADIARSLADCGYIVTKNVRDSWYTVDVKVRFFGERRDESGPGSAAGAVGGAVAGAVAGRALRHTSTAAGAVVGGLGGAFIGNTVDKHNPIRSYDFVLEVAVGERMPDGFNEKVIGQGSATSTSGFSNSVEGGTKYTGSTSYQHIATDLVRKRDFYKHKNNLTISATKRNLTADEAYDAVIGRLVRAFGGIMPDVDPSVQAVTPDEVLKSLKK